jgi:hypothetical protein
MKRALVLFAGILLGCDVTPYDVASDQPTTQPTSEAIQAAATQPAEPPDHPISTLVNGALGAGGGYVIGIEPGKSREETIRASRQAEQSPCAVEAADRAATADLNSDGCVTVDEVVAMRKANLASRDILDRMARTGHYFELTAFQKDYLRARGIKDDLIGAIDKLNDGAPQSGFAK